jgi:hypothetical protein
MAMTDALGERRQQAQQGLALKQPDVLLLGTPSLCTPILSYPSLMADDDFFYDHDPHIQGSQNLCFTRKLFDILSDQGNSHIITWNPGAAAPRPPPQLDLTTLNLYLDGHSFEVLDPKLLEKEILPQYFRHARFQSLVRQLNFYSFKASHYLYPQSISLKISILFYRKWEKNVLPGSIPMNAFVKANRSSYYR